MNKSTSTILIVSGIVLVLCCCLVVLAGGIAGIYQINKVLPTIASIVTSMPTLPSRLTPTPFEITRQPANKDIINNLKAIKQVDVPNSDPAELACRFKGVCNVPLTVPAPSAPLKTGDTTNLWILDGDTNAYSKINVTLQYITPHAYFWVEEGVKYDFKQAKQFIDTFEDKIYPTDRAFFGSEWTPGVDNDPHIYIIYAAHLGGNAAGFFDSNDEYNPLVNRYSNAHESFFIESTQSLRDAYTYGTLAHEFQHMIHWYQDRNESAFLNEGFSELASFLNGYDEGGWDKYGYAPNPDLNLTDWLGGNGDNGPHYGASFLFVTYFLDRFGQKATQAVVHDPLNGLDSIDDVLQTLQITDPATQAPISADDFFLDWTLANYIHDPKVADGRYYYHNYPNSAQTGNTETVSSCPQEGSTRTVNQYGVDYIDFKCAGKYTISFRGSTTVRLVPIDPHSGSYVFWSNKSDESDTTLSHQFDLSGISGPVTLSYWTWFDIEQDYDYLYLEASTDGQQWKILTPPSCTTNNPTGSAFGCGYSGKSNGWRQETVDLSQFSDQKIWLRFEYITDQAVTGKGFIVDDISIPALNYQEDFESGDGGWQASGFVRIQNEVPQAFRLALITHSTSGTSVEILPVDSTKSVDVPVEIGSNGVKDVVLVVTATTRITLEEAPYQFSIH
jgi:immune inhibitor A